MTEDTRPVLRNAAAVIGRIVAVAGIILALGAEARAQGTPPHPCAVRTGDAVMLKSPDIDPDVFLWDAKQRAIDYAAGQWRDAHDVMVHSLLAKPGTRASVTACDAGAVRHRYSPEPADAIGVRILNGPNRGRFGWVTSREVHLLTAQR